MFFSTLSLYLYLSRNNNVIFLFFAYFVVMYFFPYSVYLLIFLFSYLGNFDFFILPLSALFFLSSEEFKNIFGIRTVSFPLILSSFPIEIWPCKLVLFGLCGYQKWRLELYCPYSCVLYILSFWTCPRLSVSPDSSIPSPYLNCISNLAAIILH